MNSKKRERFEITQGYADRYIRDVQTDEIHNLHSACGLLNKFNDSITYYQNMLDQRDWQAVNNQNWILQKHLKEAEKEAEEYNLDAMNYQTLYEQQLEKNIILQKTLNERLKRHENCDRFRFN